MLLCPFASSAVPDALKLPPKAEGVEESRGERQSSVGQREQESLRVLEEHGGSCSALQAQGSRERGRGLGGVTLLTWARGHHQVGGQTAPAGSRRAPGGQGTARTPLPAPRRAAHPPRGPGYVSPGRLSVPQFSRPAQPGAALSRCCRPRTSPDGTARSCLARDCEVVLEPGSVFRAEERGLHQPEPKPRACESPLSWKSCDILPAWG